MDRNGETPEINPDLLVNNELDELRVYLLTALDRLAEGEQEIAEKNIQLAVGLLEYLRRQQKDDANK